MKRYLFFVEQPYCYSILRPLQQEIIAQGGDVAWYLAGKAVSASQLLPNEKELTHVDEVKAFNPLAVFVPGNLVPDFFPGIKVQIFHGLEWKKKGHFVIRNFFDLYCTHGTITTKKFERLSAQRNHFFYVKETGWPKLDPYFDLPTKQANSKNHILYAPTFSPKLTSAPALFEQIVNLSNAKKFFFTVKFHPLMEHEWVDQYTQAQNDYLQVSDNNDLLALVCDSDAVLSDTSSAVTEALLLGKKVATFNNSQPQTCLLDFSDEMQLESILLRSIADDKQLDKAIDEYINQVHPTNDGRSSQRVLEAVDEVERKGVKKKPLNFMRKLKIRKKLKYFRIS